MLFALSIYAVGYLFCCVVFMRRARDLDWSSRVTICATLSVSWVLFAVMAFMVRHDREWEK